MSQVKKLKEMGVEFEDPRMWDLIEMLDNMPAYLEEKRRKRAERKKFCERVFGEAVKTMEEIRAQMIAEESLKKS